MLPTQLFATSIQVTIGVTKEIETGNAHSPSRRQFSMSALLLTYCHCNFIVNVFRNNAYLLNTTCSNNFSFTLIFIARYFLPSSISSTALFGKEVKKTLPIPFPSNIVLLRALFLRIDWWMEYVCVSWLIISAHKINYPSVCSFEMHRLLWWITLVFAFKQLSSRLYVLPLRLLIMTKLFHEKLQVFYWGKISRDRRRKTNKRYKSEN